MRKMQYPSTHPLSQTNKKWEQFVRKIRGLICKVQLLNIRIKKNKDRKKWRENIIKEIMEENFPNIWDKSPQSNHENSYGKTTVKISYFEWFKSLQWEIKTGQKIHIQINLSKDGIKLAKNNIDYVRTMEKSIWDWASWFGNYYSVYFRSSPTY